MICISSSIYDQEFSALLYASLFLHIEDFYRKGQGTKDKVFAEGCPSFLEQVLHEKEAAELVRKYNTPRTRMEYILAVADALVCGEKDKKNDKPLLSALSVIDGIVSGKEKPKAFYKKVFFEPFIAPHPLPEYDKATWEKDCRQWWKAFLNEMEDIAGCKDNNPSKKINRLYQNLFLYTQTVPADDQGREGLPNIVSFFDRAKITAAAACALYRGNHSLDDLKSIYQILGLKKTGTCRQGDKTGETELFLLVGGDISGIQDFVFDITAQGAAKGLRGRSFYLSLLGEIISKYILRQEKLPPCNLLYAGGGHFYLLLPVSAINRLEEYRQHVEEVLLKAHGGKLTVILTGVPTRLSHFTGGSFAANWRETGALAQKAKRRKFLEVIRKDYQRVLGPFAEGQEVCTLCGSRGSKSEGKCSFCQSFEELGDYLARDYLYLNEYEVAPSSGVKINSYKDLWASLGYKLVFDHEPDPTALAAVINKPSLRNTAGDRLIWFANNAPLDEKGRIMEFAEIAERSKGEPKWGVLRGDVDNLGNIFYQGLGEDCSLPAIAALSREVDVFFSVVLNQVCRRYHDTVYVIYAGGDDFFLVGSWSVLPVVAAEINREFRRYCGHNPHVTLSCAITIAPGITYPLYKAAHQAGKDLDEKAKSVRIFNNRKHEKNSICFLGKAFTWEELEEVGQVKDLIFKAIAEEGVSKGLLVRIYSAYRDYRLYREKKYPLTRVWRLVYALNQLAGRFVQAEKTLKEIEKRVLTTRTLIAENSVYAARWAEKLMRTRGE